jgi:hypothetical protein
MNVPGRLLELCMGVPTFLVLAAGMVLAITTWWRHANASLLVFLGCLVILLMNGMQEAFYTWGLPYFFEVGFFSPDSGHLLTVVGGAFSLGRAVGYGLLIGGAFAGRRAAGR